jgi:polar amino acid transport system permease protein
LSAGRLGLFQPLPAGTDLPVLLPVRERVALRAAREQGLGFLPTLRLRSWHGALLVLVLLCASGVAEAQSAPGHASIVATLLKWTPLLLRGFVFNLAISVLAMAIGTAAGVFLGLAQISLLPPVRRVSWVATHFFRNAPWLVLLFYCMFLLPFQFKIGGMTIPLPDWIKATLGLALPVMANVSEIVRGAVQSIPTGQWESANALAFTRRQTIWMIILPQCIKRMLPPWMNLYSILTMGTVLTSIVGVSEVMTLTGEVLAAENRPELLLPIYSYILIWFFIYCYPIARLTVRLERKFAVNM